MARLQLGRRVALALALVLLGACTTRFHTPRVATPDAPAVVYTLDEDQAFRLVYLALADAYAGREVTPITGHMRGYSTYNRVAIDTFTTNILVIPVVGTTRAGQEVRGFRFDGSGSGSSWLVGRPMSNAAYENLQRALDSSGTGVPVVTMQPGVYADEER